jgi:hypothetical protein
LVLLQRQQGRVLPRLRRSDPHYLEHLVGHEALRVQNPHAALEPPLLDFVFDLKQQFADALDPATLEPVEAARLAVLGERLTDPATGEPRRLPLAGVVEDVLELVEVRDGRRHPLGPADPKVPPRSTITYSHQLRGQVGGAQP